MLTDNFGVEAGYSDMGGSNFTATSAGGESWEPGAVGTNFDAEGWLLSGLYRKPISPRVALLIRLGIFSWSTTETFTEPSGVSVDKNSGEDLYYAVGTEIDVGIEGHWYLRTEIAQTTVDDDGNDVTTGGVGFVFHY